MSVPTWPCMRVVPKCRHTYIELFGRVVVEEGALLTGLRGILNKLADVIPPTVCP